MKRITIIVAVILGIIVSFLAGSHHGYSNSPGIKSIEILRDLGMTDKEIAESMSDVSQYTAEYWENLHSQDMRGAIMGVNTLKALKEDDLPQIENLAIMQITSYYNVHVDGDKPEDELELKLQKEIRRLSLEFPNLKKEIKPSQKN